MRVSSSADRRFCRDGISYSQSQKISHTNPDAPVMINTSCHPKLTRIHGVMSTASPTPTAVPELQMPADTPRALVGNDSDIDFMPAGELPASPSPSPMRAATNPVTLLAAACSIPMRLHSTTEMVYPIFVPTRSMSHPKERRPAAYAPVKATTIMAKSDSRSEERRVGKEGRDSREQAP